MPLGGSGIGRAVAYKALKGRGSQPAAPGSEETQERHHDRGHSASFTTIGREDLLAGLSQHLPDLINQLTPNGRLPTDALICALSAVVVAVSRGEADAPLVCWLIAMSGLLCRSALAVSLNYSNIGRNDQRAGTPVASRGENEPPLVW